MYTELLTRKFWHTAWFLGFGLYLVALLYVYGADRALSSVSLSKALAATGGLLIGFSFALSGFAYYFNFLDTKVAYRKYLGLVGFWFAFIYALSLFLVDPDKYFFGFFANLLTADVLLGLGAMGILTFMALISRTKAMQWLGPQRWRKCLRLGYLAYALLVVRAVVVEWDVWTAWAENPAGRLPPPRLILSIFAVAVLLFRGSMLVSQYLRKGKSAPPLPIPSTPLGTQAKTPK
jgi:DMSO/TMAO reductase YedYZ heme-binding membrane subunit